MSYNTTEMHTAGQPVRIIETGYPIIYGHNILEKMQTLRKTLDEKRKLLMHEPRGHLNMYGVLLVPPDTDKADVGVIYMQNEGYSSMCGHVIIALGRYLIDKELIRNPTIPETEMTIQTPCGLIKAYTTYDGISTWSVRYHSIPAYVYAKDVSVNVPSIGHLLVDVVYSGTFYAIVPVTSLQLTKTSPIEKIRKAAGDTTEVLREHLKLTHPETDDLAYLTGTIVTDDSGHIRWNCCVFADRQVDRSPCGSGTTARVAQMVDNGDLEIGEVIAFEGPAGGRFNAKAVRRVQYFDFAAVVVEISGKAHYTGTTSFICEEGDEVGKGFLLT